MILECLRFVAESDEFEGEFHTRLGVDWCFVQEIIAGWPAIDGVLDQERVHTAIQNALNEVCNSVFFIPERWNAWFSHSCRDMRVVFDAWVGVTGDDLPLISWTLVQDADFWLANGDEVGEMYIQLNEKQRAEVDEAILLASQVSVMIGETYAPFLPGRLPIVYWSPIQQQAYDIHFAYLDQTKRSLAHLQECQQCRRLYRTEISSREALEAMLSEWPPRHCQSPDV